MFSKIGNSTVMTLFQYSKSNYNFSISPNDNAKFFAQSTTTFFFWVGLVVHRSGVKKNAKLLFVPDGVSIETNRCSGDGIIW